MFKVSSPSLLSSITGISEDEDEDEEYENLEVLITPWKELPAMQQFNRWLISPDGKGKGTCQARQHVRQVEIILQESSQQIKLIILTLMHVFWKAAYSICSLN